MLLYCLHSCSGHTPVRLDGAQGAEQWEWGGKEGEYFTDQKKKALTE